MTDQTTPFAVNPLLAPGVLLLRRLGPTWRLLVCATLVLGPLGWVCFGAVRDSNVHLAVVRRERLATDYVRLVGMWLWAVEQHDVLSVAAASDDRTSADDLSRAAREVELAARRVQELEAHLGRREVGRDPDVRGLFVEASAAREAWRGLKAGPPACGDQAEGDESIGDRIVRLVGRAGDVFGLTVDPEDSTQRLQDALSRHVPALAAAIGRATVEAVACGQEGDRSRLVRSAAARSRELRELEALEAAMGPVPTLEGAVWVPGIRRAALLASLPGAVRVHAQQIEAGFDDDLGHEGERTPQIVATATQAFQALFALQGVAGDDLQTLLAQREREIRWTRGLRAGAASGSALFALYLVAVLQVLGRRGREGAPEAGAPAP